MSSITHRIGHLDSLIPSFGKKVQDNIRPSDGSCDYLNLKSDAGVKTMLEKNGENTPMEERIVLSMRVTKINEKGKKQERVFLLTDKAVYNLKPNNPSKCLRRIDLRLIRGIACSETTTEFVIHVPSEYDYHYTTDRRRVVVQTIRDAYESLTKESLQITNTLEELSPKTVKKSEEPNAKQRMEKLVKWENHFEEEKSKITPYDFKVLEIIGEGGFALVTRVMKVDDGKIYAMKELKKVDLIKLRQVRNTKAEKLILESTHHPFLMHLHYAFQTETKLYMVLHFYKGGELFFHLCKMKRFNEEQARFIIAELALAIAQLHSMHMVYRDLKPENVLLDEHGHVCLTDFGLAKELEEDARYRTRSFCGTPAYMAPEVVSEKDYSFGVDWWSLGTLLFELVYGWPPFESNSEDMEAMFKKIKLLELKFPKYPAEISDNCKDCISQLLDRDESKRLCFENGVTELKEHPFFESIDWEKLLKKELEPPYCPEVSDDLDCVAKEFSDRSMKDVTAEAPGAKYRSAFRGFTVTRKKTRSRTRIHSLAETKKT